MIFVMLIICLIIYLIFLSKYEITYTYVENAYIKPKYSSHNYSSITFENGLKLILVQIDPGEEAGGAITFDYGYLDN
jgi:secreted Zn-dependent insulinase-like peptidase